MTGFLLHAVSFVHNLFEDADCFVGDQDFMDFLGESGISQKYLNLFL